MGTVFFTIFFFYQLFIFFKRGGPFAFIAASLSLSGVLITRPNAIYVLIPAVYLSLQTPVKGNSRGPALLKTGLLAIVGSILPALWYLHGWHVSRQADNIYSTLFAQLESHASFLNPLAMSVDYYGRLLDTLFGVALTPLGFTFLLLGMLFVFFDFQSSGFFLVWTLSFLFSSLAIARKLIDHNLYLLHLVIAASPLMGAAFERVLAATGLQGKRKISFAAIFGLLFFIVSMRYAVHPAFITPPQSQNTLRVAEEIKRSTLAKAKIISASPDSMSLLYYGDRLGWPFFYQNNRAVPYYWKHNTFTGLNREAQQERNLAYKKSISWLEYLRREGADYFVGTSRKDFLNDRVFAQYMESRFKKISPPDADYVFFNLHESR